MIYIASSEQHVGLIKEDIYIRDSIQSFGKDSTIQTLSNILEQVNCSDTVILKSIWDYHLEHKNFIYQLSKLSKSKVKLINDYQFIYWNINKHKYLSQISHLKIVPTELLHICKEHTTASLQSVLKDVGKKLRADALVVKPTISASGYSTFKYNTKSTDLTILDNILNGKQTRFLVQPFRSSISSGEISIISISGEILYGVKRYPGILSNKKETTYLNFNEIPTSIIDEFIRLKKFLHDKFNSFPVICRVDFITFEKNYEILEVELIDPDLFFRKIPYEIREIAISRLLSVI